MTARDVELDTSRRSAKRKRGSAQPQKIDRPYSFPLNFRAVLLASLALAASPPSSIPAKGDEFVGPFPSWTNVKTVYGAVADGTADDTAAIQQGLDELGKPGHSPVLFFPNGTYRITKTLVLASSISVSRSEEHTSELQSRPHLVCRLLLEKKKQYVNCRFVAH